MTIEERYNEAHRGHAPSEADPETCPMCMDNRTLALAVLLESWRSWSDSEDLETDDPTYRELAARIEALGKAEDGT